MWLVGHAEEPTSSSWPRPATPLFRLGRTNCFPVHQLRLASYLAYCMNLASLLIVDAFSCYICVLELDAYRAHRKYLPSLYHLFGPS